MTVTEFIDQVLARMDNIGASDAENSTRRTRYLEWTVEGVEEIRGEREWTWVQAESSAISVTSANGYASLPADFQSMGETGTVVNTATGDVLVWVPPKDIIEARRGVGGTTSSPEIYSVFDQDDTTGQILIQLPPLASNISLRVLYLASAPTLDESTNVDNLKVAVPAHYHQKLLMPLVRHKSQISKGDARSTEWLDLYRRNLAGAIRREFPAGKASPRGLRSFFGV